MVISDGTGGDRSKFVQSAAFAQLLDTQSGHVALLEVSTLPLSILSLTTTWWQVLHRKRSHDVFERGATWEW